MLTGPGQSHAPDSSDAGASTGYNHVGEPPGHLVLAIDDDAGVLELVRRVLTEAGFRVRTAETAAEGLRAVVTDVVDAVVIDFRLPGCDGLHLARVIQLVRPDLPWMMLSAYLCTDVTVDAVRLGAAAVMDKPFDVSRFIEAVRSTVAAKPAGQTNEDGIDAESLPYRWARFVILASGAARDPRTIPMWARVAGASASVVRGTCRLVGLRALRSRDLARVLRVIVRRHGDVTHLAGDLSIADDRTLKKMKYLAGLVKIDGVVTAREFLFRQRFVPTGSDGMRALMRLLGHSSAE